MCLNLTWPILAQCTFSMTPKNVRKLQVFYTPWKNQSWGGIYKQVFSCEFCEIFKNTFFQNTSRGSSASENTLLIDEGYLSISESESETEVFSVFGLSMLSEHEA